MKVLCDLHWGHLGESDPSVTQFDLVTQYQARMVRFVCVPVHCGGHVGECDLVTRAFQGDFPALCGHLGECDLTVTRCDLVTPNQVKGRYLCDTTYWGHCRGECGSLWDRVTLCDLVAIRYDLVTQCEGVTRCDLRWRAFLCDLPARCGHRLGGGD